MTSSITTRSTSRAFGGTVGFYSHDSTECTSEMRFSVFTPPAAERGPVPVLYFLAGLASTEETFMTKAGALRAAADLGLMLVAPDTSPRSPTLAGDEDHWDFGKGAGFYLDATRDPWSAHYRMASYVTRELPGLIAADFPALPGSSGICGHSMGGHGALVLALRNPCLYRSVSAFSPICHPSEVPWGQKAFTNYLGPDPEGWRQWDACDLVQALPEGASIPPILVDQGTTDKFLDAQLRPEHLEQACQSRGVSLTLRRHPGYDHGYYFISTFIDDHLRHHAAALLR